MRWQSVALAAMALPPLTGCSIVETAARNIVNEPRFVCNEYAIEHDLRKAAKTAWRDVRAEYPRRDFSREFRDGFLDGFVDYLDRGGNGSLPAVPPAKYIRDKKYFTEEGHCLMQEYFLGFQYGQEIALATGKREFLTIPVLLPDERPQPPAFVIDPAAGHRAPPMPIPVPPAVDKKPPATTATLPFPTPLPQSGSPASSSLIAAPLDPRPATDVPKVRIPTAPIPRLPAPPCEVPDLPAHVPTPSVVDDLPIVPPVHAAPPIVPPCHPEPRKE
jgi:hypothetical protein